MSETSPCALWTEVQPFWRRDKELKVKLSLEISATDEVTVVYCKGRIVYRDEAAAFSGKLTGLLPRTRQIVLVLSGVEMIDSAGLGELVRVRRRALASRCSIKLAALSSRIHSLLELTNLISVFEIHPTLEDAILAFRGQVV
jgi:anti-anti-sigma factor